MAAKKKTTTKTKNAAAKKKTTKETGTTPKKQVKKETAVSQKTTDKEADVKAEEKRLAEEAAKKAEEEKRLAEEAAKKAEEKRLAEEAAKKAEEKRLAEEAAKKAEEKRLAEEAAKKAEEEKRLAEEAAKKAEEKRLAEEAAKKAEEEKRLAEEAAKRAIEIQKVIREIAEREAMEAESAKNLLQDTDSFVNKEPKPRAAIWAGIVFVLIVLMIMGASINNAQKYYVKHTRAGVEIWKGQFAPVSMEKVLFIKGMNLPEFTEKSYSKQDIFPIPFNYYINMANDLIKKESEPNFQTILDIVDKASNFATTMEEKEKIELYKTTINQASEKIESNKIILPVEPLKEEILPEVNSVEEAAPAVAQEAQEAIPALTEEVAPAQTEETAPVVEEEPTEKETSEHHNQTDSQIKTPFEPTEDSKGVWQSPTKKPF